MTGPSRRLVERISDPSYLGDLASKSIEDLRAMREECREGENELSFERRLCQARMDILKAELDRRSGKSEGGLLERLPEILAADSGGGGKPLPDRAPDFSVPRNVDVPRRRVEEIVGEQTLGRLSQLSAEEIASIIESLKDHERVVSDRRNRVHEVLDAIQTEIVRRYSTGEADPSAAMG